MPSGLKMRLRRQIFADACAILQSEPAQPWQDFCSSKKDTVFPEAFRMHLKKEKKDRRIEAKKGKRGKRKAAVSFVLPVLRLSKFEIAAGVRRKRSRTKPPVYQASPGRALLKASRELLQSLLPFLQEDKLPARPLAFLPNWTDFLLVRSGRISDCFTVPPPGVSASVLGWL